ncbi:uncharacterized protein E6C27_scaffold543G00710 [Cucumis melo var. makuwa]|uniref:Flocculation protein FLO11-like n=1 Tax=Cucumis melo var. makuwa TaxID=1194695 RepID=A0A5A7TUG5_CUCMM|nr:uncharacterized protein E6C27_scaffold543G00710 [Cucumis melo var. makuwa]
MSTEDIPSPIHTTNNSGVPVEDNADTLAANHIEVPYADSAFTSSASPTDKSTPTKQQQHPPSSDTSGAGALSIPKMPRCSLTKDQKLKMLASFILDSLLDDLVVTYSSNEQMTIKLSGGTVRTWPNDGQLPKVSLSMEYAILHKIATRVLQVLIEESKMLTSTIRDLSTHKNAVDAVLQDLLHLVPSTLAAGPPS